jgi:hypothetical protein
MPNMNNMNINNNNNSMVPQPFKKKHTNNIWIPILIVLGYFLGLFALWALSQLEKNLINGTGNGTGTNLLKRLSSNDASENNISNISENLALARKAKNAIFWLLAIPIILGLIAWIICWANKNKKMKAAAAVNNGAVGQYMETPYSQQMGGMGMDNIYGHHNHGRSTIAIPIMSNMGGNVGFTSGMECQSVY